MCEDYYITYRAHRRTMAVHGRKMLSSPAYAQSASGEHLPTQAGICLASQVFNDQLLNC